MCCPRPFLFDVLPCCSRPFLFEFAGLSQTILVLCSRVVPDHYCFMLPCCPRPFLFFVAVLSQTILVLCCRVVPDHYCFMLPCCPRPFLFFVAVLSQTILVLCCRVVPDNRSHFGSSISVSSIRVSNISVSPQFCFLISHHYQLFASVVLVSCGVVVGQVLRRHPYLSVCSGGGIHASVYVHLLVLHCKISCVCFSTST